MSGEPGAPLLAARGIAKRYGEREALRDVDVDAHAGELVAVIGPNGAGKTTLLSILAGAQPSSAGTIELAEGGVGWVPQQTALYSRLTVAENLELFARLEGTPDPRRTVRAMLEQTGLRERADERVGRLSGGNRQRVNIALGLLADPPVLILDEPSSSLDPRQRERLWRFVLESSGRGRAVVFSTHNVAEAERYADRVLVLADGELLFGGTPAELACAADSEGRLHAAGESGSRAAGESGSRAEGESGSRAEDDERDPRAAGSGRGLDFEGAFVEFLRARGH